MPAKYHQLTQDGELTNATCDCALRHNQGPANKKIILFFFVITLFNMILAAANAHYCLQLAEALRRCEEKDLALLPQIDPFDGTYISFPQCKRSLLLIPGFVKILSQTMGQLAIEKSTERAIYQSEGM
jgi:hypothetical protein